MDRGRIGPTQKLSTTIEVNAEKEKDSEAGRGFVRILVNHIHQNLCP